MPLPPNHVKPHTAYTIEDPLPDAVLSSPNLLTIPLNPPDLIRQNAIIQPRLIRQPAFRS
jgi:hypothetical protein